MCTFLVMFLQKVVNIQEDTVYCKRKHYIVGTFKNLFLKLSHDQIKNNTCIFFSSKELISVSAVKHFV